MNKAEMFNKLLGIEGAAFEAWTEIDDGADKIALGQAVKDLREIIEDLNKGMVDCECNGMEALCEKCGGLGKVPAAESQEKSERLTILTRLENYRKRIEEKPDSAGRPDHIVRMCEAHVAHGVFENREEWTKLLKEAVEA